MAYKDESDFKDYMSSRRIVSYPPEPLRLMLKACSEITGFSESHVMTQALDIYFKSMSVADQQRIKDKAFTKR